MRAAVVIGLALMASACATTYGEIGGWEQDGVSADRIAADTFRIRSRGNANTESATIEDFALLRAAETVKGACFTHFVVLDGADRTEVEENVTPESSTTTVEEKEVDGEKVTVEHHSFTPATHFLSVRPGTDMVIRAMAVRPGAGAPEGAVSADEVIRFVSPRVERRKDTPAPVFPDCAAEAGI